MFSWPFLINFCFNLGSLIILYIASAISSGLFGLISKAELFKISGKEETLEKAIHAKNYM